MQEQIQNQWKFGPGHFNMDIQPILRYNINFFNYTQVYDLWIVILCVYTVFCVCKCTCACVYRHITRQRNWKESWCLHWIIIRTPLPILQQKVDMSLFSRYCFSVFVSLYTRVRFWFSLFHNSMVLRVFQHTYIRNCSFHFQLTVKIHV